MVRVIIVLLTFLLVPFVTTATHNALYIGYNCTGSTNSSPGSNRATPSYLYNLYNLLGTFTSQASSTAYYNSSLGQNPNRVHAFFICRFDQDARSCSSCINEAKDRILKACPYQTEAIIWYENCMMRYSRFSFFGKMDVSPMVPITAQQNISKNQVAYFAESMRKSMGDLATLVADIPPPGSKFEMRKVNISGFGNLYEMAQCVPDITAKDCHLCLTTAVERVAVSVSARALLPSCIVWYQTTPFFNSSAITYPFFSSPVTHPSSTTPSGKKKKSSHIVVAVSVSIVLAILFLSSACFCIYRHKRKKPSSDMEDIVGLESLQFDFRTIKDATDNFSFRNKLGQGGFGVVYKGKLQDGQEIAVKRLSMYSGQGISEFKTEILLAAKLQHNNLVKLLGFSLHGEEKLLVYELLPNASLDKVLFGQNKHLPLDWETRHKILLGTARGLLYLHEDSRLKIIHRDLKSSNILLDSTMNPKITDFGLARLVGRDQNHADTSKIAGTYGYMAPEYALTGRFSVMSDVYSFGIIALELISGHMCSSVAFPYHEESLPLRAWNLWKDNATLELVDPRLDGNFSSDEMSRCIHIGLLCIQEDAKKRPTMATIVSALNGHQVALSNPEPPLIGPSINITFGFNQNLGLSSSNEFLSNTDNITEVHPR